MLRFELRVNNDSPALLVIECQEDGRNGGQVITADGVSYTTPEWLTGGVYSFLAMAKKWAIDKGLLSASFNTYKFPNLSFHPIG